MKKTFVLLGIMMLTLMQVLATAPLPYKLKVLTFEDGDAKDGFMCKVYDEDEGDYFEWYRTNNSYYKYLLWDAEETLFDYDRATEWGDFFNDGPLPSTSINPWSRLITPNQNSNSYANPMLYTDEYDDDIIYYWYDGGNTGLRSPKVISDFYGGGQ